MVIEKLTVIKDYPKTLPIPKGHFIWIYKTDKQYLVEFLPNNESPRIICPSETNIYFNEDYISHHKDIWIKIINEEEDPLEITVEFYIP